MINILSNSKLVMIGDSITDCERARTQGEGLFDALGKGYVSFVDGLLTAQHIVARESSDLLNRPTSTHTVPPGFMIPLARSRSHPLNMVQAWFDNLLCICHSPLGSCIGASFSGFMSQYQKPIDSNRKMNRILMTTLSSTISPAVTSPSNYFLVYVEKE